MNSQEGSGLYNASRIFQHRILAGALLMQVEVNERGLYPDSTFTYVISLICTTGSFLSYQMIRLVL